MRHLKIIRKLYHNKKKGGAVEDLQIKMSFHSAYKKAYLNNCNNNKIFKYLYQLLWS